MEFNKPGAFAAVGMSLALALVIAAIIFGGVRCHQQKHQTCQVYASEGLPLPPMCQNDMR